MIMMMMMNTATMTNYAPIMAMAMKRKTKLTGMVKLYNHGDHVNQDDDDYNDMPNLVIMMTNLNFHCKGFSGSPKK